MWSKIMKQYKATPRLIRYGFLILLIVVCIGTFALTSCGIVTPSKEYAKRTEERADLHFPRYKMLIGDATRKQLETLTGEEPGTYKNLSDGDIQAYRAQLEREIDSWHTYIRANSELIRNLNKDKEKGK